MPQPIYRVISSCLNHFINKKIYFFAFLLAAVVNASCDSNPAATHLARPADSIALIKLPIPGPLNLSEINRIRNACQQWYDTVFTADRFNGGMIVAKKGNIIFERYNGSGHLAGTDTINANTPTHIASVTKTFTAMALLKLMEEGKVQADAELNHYFPGFNYPGVTVRNLLNHRSGLPNYLYFMDDLKWDSKLYIKNQDVYDWLVNRKAEIKDIRAPDTHFNYCNTNYALLALLIEKITGTSYPQYMRETFFIPLQMSNSFVFTLADSTRANPSYDWRGGLIPFNYLDGVYGDKNIYSTPRDLLKWDRALSTNIIFKPETLLEAYTPYSNEKPGIKNYGLGWRMNIYPDGKKIIFHNGWWHGNNAVFIRMMDEDATIIVMGNRFSRGIYKAKYLVNVFNFSFLNETVEE